MPFLVTANIQAMFTEALDVLRFHTFCEAQNMDGLGLCSCLCAIKGVSEE